MVLGFSTGSLAKGKFRLGLQMVQGKKTAAIELSALRDSEIEGLVSAINELDLSEFQYISVHAPSRFELLAEVQIVDLLKPIFDRHWAVVVHPDVIEDFSLWDEYGNDVCIENMDKRKLTGRTAAELSRIFDQLPAASFCFDIAHAHQIDPTMMEARRILKSHGERLRQVHLSTVNSASRHEPLSYPSMLSYQSIASLIPRNVPVIIESPVEEDEIELELRRIRKLFEGN